MSKKIVGTLLVGGAILLLFVSSERPKPYKGFLDKTFAIDQKQFDTLIKFLEEGLVEQEGAILDFSKVQTITINGGDMTFDPPVKVQAKTVIGTVRTSFSKIEKSVGEKVFIDIHNSPIDVEIVPNGE